MKPKEFLKKFPDLEGYTIGRLRINDVSGEVAGFVLIDKEGNKRYIIYITEDTKIEPYW